MTDIKKIREYLVGMANAACCNKQTAKDIKEIIIPHIDSLQEEPVKIKKGCKYRSISNVTNNDTGNISFVAGKIYFAPEDDTLVSEEYGWLCDTSEDSSNFELVEKPVSEDLEEAAINYMKSQNPPIWGLYDGFIAGANWKEEKLMKNVVLETEVLRDSDGDGVEIPYESWLTLANTEIPELPESLGMKEGDKVKILIVKSD